MMTTTHDDTPDTEDLGSTSSPRPAASGVRSILVLGLGNILLRDEGVGVRVVEAMQDRELPPDVELFDGATAGLDLLDVLADRRTVIVIDAVEGDSAPGTVLRLRPDDLLSGDGPGVSLHETGLIETLAVARRLGTAPQEVIVFGVRPQEVGYGLTLSFPIARLVPRIVELIVAELER
jgi:hydrogenase maturation protease